ncbi:uncharacterized protein BubR1 [Eurosta solidaginis]|uniref:uncharacterized protein BubR1 n=1 Tax=Eurosta solidaginis TaxID=178769 RepID=UPI00353137C1
MDFEDVKENIQPLAAGRNASILHASLRVDSPQEILAQRRELEQAIHDYKGNDPLDPWYGYISWIEQSFPSGGKESGLEEVLTKCLSRFADEERYFQDRRMVKLYMKFIESHQNPMECYEQLFNAGIGTMVADFYICWAYHYDLCGNTRKADEIFRRGMACRAQPLEELQEAHIHFGFTVAQRIMYQDDDNMKENTKRQFAERRLALTSLRGHKKKATVGSIRTGAAIKSYTPGTVEANATSIQQASSNTRIPVFNDENATPSVISVTNTEQEILAQDDGKSVVHSIIDAVRNQENVKEPGPWNKAHNKKKAGKLFRKTLRNTDLGFNIHEDIEMVCDDDINNLRKSVQPTTNIGEENIMPFKYPNNFKHKNLPQEEWITPVTTENEPDPHTFPQYNKSCMYPRPNVEFQPEEYRAYCWLRKRGVSNSFTAKRDIYWKSNDINVNVRLYPNFARQSKPQKFTVLDAYFEPERMKGLKVCFNKLYDTEKKVEYQLEELMANYLRRHDTILMDANMDETTCGMVSERVQRRKSFFPSRRSIMQSRRTLALSGVKECNTMERNAIGGAVETKLISNNNVPDDSLVFVKEMPESTGPKINPTNLATKFEILEGTTNNQPTIGTYKHEDVDLAANTDFNIKKSDTNLNLIKLADPFKIFEDTANNIPVITVTTSVGKTKLICQNSAGILPTASDLKFKTPALPNTLPSNVGCKSTTSTNKLAFDIYTESSVAEESPLTGYDGGSEGAMGGALFDADETCSTQTFNVFIKSQSVSTPKMSQKVAPLRQFGSILKPIPQQPEEVIRSPSPEPSATIEQIIEEQENVIKEPSDYSPLMPKQLSTILETSEHATTQGTHTTGGTKSSISTSDGEGERGIVTRLLFPQTALEPLEERSRESSTMPAEVISSLENIHLQANTTTAQSNSTTAVNKHESIENQPISQTNVPPDPATTPAQQIGNFTRMDEREDTAAGLAICSVRFQEDKPETVSKFFLNSRSLAKFQEDKTETLPSIPIPTMAQYEIEQHNNMPKLPKVSSILFAAKNATTNLDDSFEFFGQTPPGKSLLHPRYEVSAFKECMEARTPLSLSANRHCNVNTPDMMQMNAPRSVQKQDITAFTKNAIVNSKEAALFEDEVDKITTKDGNLPLSQSKPIDIQKPIAPSVPIVHKVIARDSFVPDFSFIEETQPPFTKKASIQINDSKSEKSSIVAALGTQAQNELVKRTEAVSTQSTLSQSKLNTNKSDSTVTITPPIITTSSMPDTLQAKLHMNDKSDLGNSYLKDFSFVPESQPIANTNNWLSNRSISSKINPPMQITDSYLKDCSLTLEAPPPPTQPIECKTKQPGDNFQKLTVNPTPTKPLLFLNSYMKDFAGFDPMSTKKSTSSLTFLNQSKSSEFRDPEVPLNMCQFNEINTVPKSSKLLFLDKCKISGQAAKQPQSATTNRFSAEKSFELNAETAMFATNISMIKNSTLLPNTSKGAVPKIKQGNESKIPQFLGSNIKQPNKTRAIIEISLNDQPTTVGAAVTDDDDDDDAEMSIYFKHTPKTPKIQQHVWNESSPSPKTPSQNVYVHRDVDMNATNQVIDNVNVDTNVNPFNGDLQTAFLEQIYFSHYIKELPNCMMVGHVSRLHATAKFKINDIQFEVIKLVGEGAYGAVYCGLNTMTGKKCALKQERPPNFWEYYICLEVHSRLKSDDLVCAFMSIDYALIGNNASILISPFSVHGSLITVCNKIKKYTSKNVDEYVVMLLTCELLGIIDHLHAVDIIHADIKADNFILMNKLEYPSTQYALQLIDFGVSIDMKLFKPGQTFNYVHNENAFKCVEMREGRSWTYQLDLYGLAGVIHVLLFGKFMDITQRPNGTWTHKTHIPRYINRTLWDTIFEALLNVRDCETMPNLQNLRALIKEEIADKEKFVLRKVTEFNSALTNS